MIVLKKQQISYYERQRVLKLFSIIYYEVRE